MKVKYVKQIPEEKLEQTLQKYIDEGWHWWPQTYHSERLGKFAGDILNKEVSVENTRVYWSFILSRED